MTLIEPCCTSKHVPQLLAKVKENKTELWCAYGDLTLPDLLPPLLAYYTSGIELTIVAPRIQSYVADTLRQLVSQRAIHHLYILTDARGERGADVVSLAHLLSAHVTLASHIVSDTSLLLPDMVLHGNIGRGGEHIGVATCDTRLCAELREWCERAIRQYRLT